MVGQDRGLLLVRVNWREDEVMVRFAVGARVDQVVEARVAACFRRAIIGPMGSPAVALVETNWPNNRGLVEEVVVWGLVEEVVVSALGGEVVACLGVSSGARSRESGRDCVRS